MKNVLFILLTLFFFTSCRKDNSSPPLFRIENSTSFLIESARVKLGTSENSYLSIKPGAISEFKEFSDYNYPNIKLRINNQDIEFTIQPTESPIALSGKDSRNIKSTAVITYGGSNPRFDVHFRNE